MKIWHIGASPSPQAINGVNNIIWPVAIEQVHQGHQVNLILNQKPTHEGIALADQEGLQLTDIQTRLLAYHPTVVQSFLETQRPDIVHFHSIFIPRHSLLARKLKQHHIPYLITPHAITPQLLQRRWLKKWIYSTLIEKSYFRAAAGVTVVTPPEQKALMSFVPDYSGRVDWIANPIPANTLTNPRWQEKIIPKRVVYLGRFDVLHKGIDRLVELAKLLPEIEFHLYGVEDHQTRRWLHQIQRNSPKNVSFHPPVLGAEKFKILTESSLYLQMSRWEVFGLSIAEAMALGVPCAVANTINLAESFQSHNLGLVLSENLSQAASQLRQALEKPTQLKKWSQQGESFAQAHFQAPHIAHQYLNFYQALSSTTAANHPIEDSQKISLPS